ncbi:voltage-dependent calcium channel gamma-5 subunit-like [Pecten maximus]|uniref:voltage-dependent calcium channel gamma-5 subunit-like n=1 Tax=Pecten maximus TaxID=6579 RepID=UPI0014589290|nr:voltage-dependent calcium channel gamma-5 subunit-like [Pecten maximus]
MSVGIEPGGLNHSKRRTLNSLMGVGIEPGGLNHSKRKSLNSLMSVGIEPGGLNHSKRRTLNSLMGVGIEPGGLNPLKTSVIFTDNVTQSYSCVALEYTIDYHRTRQDDQPISMSIAEAQMGATPFFVTSLVLALCSGVFSVMGTLQRNAKAIISAVLSILQGLCMAVGIILYITFINDEASHAKPDAGFFQYQYSWSIILVGLAFLASQSTAIVSVTLYLKLNTKKEDMALIIPGLEDKIKDDPETTGVTNYSTPIF